MEDTRVSDKLELLKKLRKIFAISALCAAAAAFVILVVYHFVPVMNLVIEKYPNGFGYRGYQAIYFGFGIQFIPDYVEFGFNVVMFIGMWLPMLSLIVCTALMKKGKNRMKAVLEFVTAACLLAGGIILLNCTSLAVNVAGTKNDFAAKLAEAIRQGNFTRTAYTFVTFAVCIVAALVKAAYGALLLYQRSYARKNAQK